MDKHIFFRLAASMMNHIGLCRWQQALDVCVRIQVEIQKKMEKEDA